MIIHQFGVVQVHRSISNLLYQFIAEITRLVEFFNTCSGQFEFTEASLNTSVQFGCESSRELMHQFSACQMHRTFSNLLETQYSKVLNKSFGWFEFTEPHLNTSLKALAHDSSGASNLLRTILNYIIAEIARCAKFLNVFKVVQHYRTFTRQTFKGDARFVA